MIEVSKNEFYRKINPLNVHPHSQRDHTTWEMQDGSRRVIGKSVPGYVMSPGEQKRYWLIADLLR